MNGEKCFLLFSFLLWSNAAFSLLPLPEQVVQGYLCLHDSAVLASGYSVCGDKGEHERFPSPGMLCKAYHFVVEFHLILLADGEGCDGEFHLAETNGVVGTLYHKVYLCALPMR